MSKQKSIYKQMRTVNKWFHFTRNNPRNCDYFYFLLIDSIGADKWKTLNDDIKNEWKKGKDSFDRLYGLERSGPAKTKTKQV